MKNAMNANLKKFVEKVQNTMRDLSEEYNSLPDEGLYYECPLTKLIDDGRWIAEMDVADVISENIYY